MTNLLIIEDEILIQQSLKKLFERKGFFEMSCWFYKSLEEFHGSYEFLTAQLYEPSKRLVKRG